MSKAALLRAGLVALVATAALSACSSSDSAAGSGFVAGDGSLITIDAAHRVPAPDITGTTLDGQTVSLSDYRGKVVVMNVWASWCAPCRAEAPILQKTYEDQKDSGVQFIGLDTRDSDTSAAAFVKRFGITYPNIVDRDGRQQLRFAGTLPPQAIPSTIVIDEEGRVAGRALGTVSESTLLALIKEARA